MKTSEEVKPSYAPLYAAACYPLLAEICVKHGYALAVHGSLARDLDLIAVPWADNPSSMEEVIAEINAKTGVAIMGDPTTRAHGRVAYFLSVGFGHCSVDFSFFPSTIKTV